MIGKVFFILCSLVLLSPVYPSALTKEITAEQSPQLKFRDILAELERTDILSEAFYFIFNNFEEVYSNLNVLIQSQDTLDISEIVNILNFGLGQRLLLVDKNYLQADLDGFEQLLSDRMRSVVKSLFPKDYLQQLVVFGALQKQIHSSVSQIRPKIENRKISVDEINARINTDQLNTETRATDLISALQETVCNSIIDTLYSQLNETFTTATTFLDAITVTSSDDNLLSLVANLVSFGVDLAKQGIALVWDLAESFHSSVCSTILSITSSSRKRRDLTFSEELINLTKGDTALATTNSQVVGIRSLTVITTVLWYIVSAILSYAVSSLFDQLISSVTSYLISIVAEWLSSLIDSIF